MGLPGSSIAAGPSSGASTGSATSQVFSADGNAKGYMVRIAIGAYNQESIYTEASSEEEAKDKAREFYAARAEKEFGDLVQQGQLPSSVIPEPGDVEVTRVGPAYAKPVDFTGDTCPWD